MVLATCCGLDRAEGITVVFLAQADLATMHGVNERLAVSELHAGVARLTRIVADIAGALRPQFKD